MPGTDDKKFDKISHHTSSSGGTNGMNMFRMKSISKLTDQIYLDLNCKKRRFEEVADMSDEEMFDGKKRVK